jgi:hypothetical protein
MAEKGILTAREAGEFAFWGVRHEWPSPGAGPRTWAGRPDLGWPGMRASRLSGPGRSIRRTGQSCQGQSSGGPARCRRPRGARGSSAPNAAARGGQGSTDYAATQPAAGSVTPRTSAGGLWAAAGQSPRWARIFSMTSGCSMNAMMRIGAAHRGHISGSTS